MKRIWILLIIATHSLFAGFYAGVEGGYMRNFGVFDIYQNNLTPLNLKRQELGENGIVGNVVLGTEHFFFNDYLGIRWGIFGGYGATWGKNDTYGNLSTSTLSVGISTDVIINFIAKENFTAGFILGMGYSYNTFKPNKNIEYGNRFKYSFPIYRPNNPFPTGVYNGEDNCFVNNQASYWTPTIRVGTTFLLNKHHRFEVFAKLPLTTIKKDNQARFEYNNKYWNGPAHQKYDTKVSYKHSFLQAFASYKFVY